MRRGSVLRKAWAQKFPVTKSRARSMLPRHRTRMTPFEENRFGRGEAPFSPAVILGVQLRNSVCESDFDLAGSVTGKGLRCFSVFYSPFYARYANSSRGHLLTCFLSLQSTRARANSDGSLLLMTTRRSLGAAQSGARLSLCFDCFEHSIQTVWMVWVTGALLFFDARWMPHLKQSNMMQYPEPSHATNGIGLIFCPSPSSCSAVTRIGLVLLQLMTRPLSGWSASECPGGSLGTGRCHLRYLFHLAIPVPRSNSKASPGTRGRSSSWTSASLWTADLTLEFLSITVPTNRNYLGRVPYT